MVRRSRSGAHSSQFSRTTSVRMEALTCPRLCILIWAAFKRSAPSFVPATAWRLRDAITASYRDTVFTLLSARRAATMDFVRVIGRVPALSRVNLQAMINSDPRVNLLVRLFGALVGIA